jgi:hypothetical protein
MATYNKFNDFVRAACQKEHNIGTDQLKVALTNVAPVATNVHLADLTEIAYTNLSTRNVTTSSATQTGGTFSAVCSDLVLTSSGGTTGPFRYVVIYNDSSASKDLIAWFDYGSSITLADGETLTLHFGANLFSLS